MNFLKTLLAFFGISTADTDVIIGRVNKAVDSLKDHIDILHVKAEQQEQKINATIDKHDEALAAFEARMQKRVDSLFRRQDNEMTKLDTKATAIQTNIATGLDHLRGMGIDFEPSKPNAVEIAPVSAAVGAAAVVVTSNK
jgi:hypothetical protein